MDASPEGDVTVVGTGEVQFVRPFELLGIAVGAAEMQRQAGPRWHRTAGDLGVLGGDAEVQLQGCIVAQELFDRIFNEIGLLTEQLHLVRVAQQREQAVADKVRRRIVADREQEAQHR